MNEQAKVGDWISFYRGGMIAIAEVRYIRQKNSYSGDVELCTTGGSIDADAVLEIRRG